MIESGRISRVDRRDGIGSVEVQREKLEAAEMCKMFDAAERS